MGLRVTLQRDVLPADHVRLEVRRLAYVMAPPQRASSRAHPPRFWFPRRRGARGGARTRLEVEPSATPHGDGEPKADAVRREDVELRRDAEPHDEPRNPSVDP